MHTIKRKRHRKKNEEEEEENPVTTDVATAKNIALPRVVRRRVATRIVPTAAEVTVTSGLRSPDITDGVPAVIGKVDGRCYHGGSNSRGKIKKGRRNS